MCNQLGRKLLTQDVDMREREIRMQVNYTIVRCV